MNGGEQILQCATCGQMTRHRPTPPDGWLRCERCVPHAQQPQQVVVQNFMHWILPIVGVGIAAILMQQGYC